MASYINIEDRYRCASLRERKMHHVWAATAAAVISVGAAAAGTAMSVSASQKAAKQQAAAAKKAQRKEGKALKGFQKGQAQIETDLGQIQAPVMDIGADIADAERITGYNLAQLEKFYPGAANQRQLASMAITDMIQGKLPQANISETMREAAYRGGAGFNLATAGKGAIAQAPQYDYARAIGATSLALTQAGLDQSAKWQNLSRGFIQEPLQVGQMRLQYGTGAANIALEKAGIRSNMLAAQYGAQTGASQKQYQRQQDLISTNLATQQQMAEGISKTGQAVSSGVYGAGGAWAEKIAAEQVSTTPMESGFYRGQVGAANAYGVAPSQLSYQAPSGGFLGMGGQGGGYYYNPSGVYGR